MVMSRQYAARVRTHPQSPAESNHTRNDAADWLTYDGRVRECVQTAQSSRAESCHIKCPDAARLNFVSRTAVIVRDGCYLGFGIAVERFIV